MEIRTVLDELYHVRAEDEGSVIQQIYNNYPYILFKEREKTIILIVKNIVSIESFKQLKIQQ